MVLVIVITVLHAVRHVGCLHQRQHQRFHRLRPVFYPKFSQSLTLLLANASTNTEFQLANSFRWKTLLLPMQGASNQALTLAFKEAFRQVLNQILWWTLSECVLHWDSSDNCCQSRLGKSTCSCQPYTVPVTHAYSLVSRQLMTLGCASHSGPQGGSYELQMSAYSLRAAYSRFALLPI